MDIRSEIPALGYLAPAVERFCSAQPEDIPALVRAAGPGECSELSSIVHRLLANGAADLVALGLYLETLTTTDPVSAARLEALIRSILPVRG